MPWHEHLPRRMRMAKARWLYYVVENAWVARLGEDGLQVQVLKPDGCWEPLPFHEVWTVSAGGRQVAGEEEALEEAREIFELRGQAHALGGSAKGNSGSEKETK